MGLLNKHGYVWLGGGVCIQDLASIDPSVLGRWSCVKGFLALFALEESVDVNNLASD